MSYEVKLNDRLARVEVINQDGNQLLVSVDGKEYELDFVQIGKGSYSILHKNRSYNVELIPVNGIKRYQAHTLQNSFDVEIIDAESKYIASRKREHDAADEAVISSPIPGRVVSIMVSEGETVEAGQSLVIISAMKMESEFRAPRAGKVISVMVTEGQSVEARQELVLLEYS